MEKQQFDIVIPLGPNEITNIEKQIQYTCRNVIGYRNIYIVTCNMEIKLDNCIIINESIFPFKEYISNYFMTHFGKSNRNGWYFQQLIKLYAGHYIEGILDNYLVIDADVFFLKPISVITNKKPTFALSIENYVPYFEHMKRVHPELQKMTQYSGIVHHMLFTKKYVNELMDMVENYHAEPFWQVFISKVTEHLNHNAYFSESGASEYEMYFNFMVKYHKNDMVMRLVNWRNVNRHGATELSKYSNFDYVSVCSWIFE